ncbi:MAG: hypothetical protein AAF236_01680 [Verrucomicrobiota bacterium]
MTPSIDINETDRHHLQLLSVFHKVYGWLCLLGLLGLLAHFAFAAFLFFYQDFAESGFNSIFAVFIVFYLIGALILIALAIANFKAAGALADLRSKTLCFVVACVNCLNMPIGMVLGIFTIIVIMRPQVSDAFRS